MKPEDTFAALYGLAEIGNSLGTLVPINEFRLGVRGRKYQDNRGFGRWATETHFWPVSLPEYLTARSVKPSSFQKHNFKPPHWATHVLWYDK